MKLAICRLHFVTYVPSKKFVGRNAHIDAVLVCRLGAVHDGSPPPTYLGGPGAEKCRWEDGFIMSDLRHSEKGFKWSPCSVSSFHHFLKYV